MADNKLQNKCAFSGCSSVRNDVTPLFSFRKYDCDTWMKLCNNPHLFHINKNTLLRNCKVCYKHFDKSDFTRKFSPFDTKLSRFAFPKGIPDGKLNISNT